MGLAQNLKAVADAQHQPALPGELRHLLHHRGEPGDRAGPEIVAVGEPSGHDHRIDALEVPIPVPEQHGVADPPGGLEGVHLVTRAGEADHAELHGESSAGRPAPRSEMVASPPASLDSISYSSISGLDSNRSHMSGSWAGSSTSSSIS